MARIGLALGGGAVRGLAHIGVLEAIERHNLPVDVVTGTSVGSLVGALYCAGFRCARLRELASELAWPRIARLVWPRRGLITFQPLERYLIRLLGDIHFSDLEIPLAVVATDMESGEPVVLSEGPLAPAVRASCSVPGLVEPRKLNGRLLADGALVNSVPVSLARDLGADYVIGVDIFQPGFNRRGGPVAYGLEAIEILVQRSGNGSDTADCLIRPELSGFTYWRFASREKLIEAGARAAESQLRPELIRAAQQAAGTVSRPQARLATESAL
jgi:NTE family protein